MLLAGAGRAQIVGAPNVPGHLRPTVLMAPNGVPLVNIQTPSAAGVSRNVYNQFDVMRNGAILNNSRVNVQTQLGGFVQGNPWLARGPARVILNEINSGNPTQLRGHVEVGGQRAEVIIANPAGISVDGGGFINASRATLTTGVPQLNALGGLDGFLVRDGTVSIEGAGLDVSKTDYAAILARAVQVNAGIWASELQVVAGANQVSTDHGSVTPVAGNGPAPAFALDVAALGGMYAQKITLVGTEAGLGVRNAGNVGAGAGGLVVTAQGRLENTGTLEGARVQLTSGADIDNRGGTIRQASMAGLTIDSPVLSNTNAGVIGAEPLASAAGEGSTSAAFAAPASSQAPAAPGTIAAAGTIRNDGGRIYVGGPITLKTPQISNAGGTLNVATMAVTGASFSNAGGTLNVSQSFGANVGRFDNAGGKLNAGSLQIATSGDLINTDGTLTSGSDASLVVGGNADNTRGTISAMGRLMANVVKAVDNSAGTLVANEGLVLDAGMLNNSGAIRAGNDVGLAVAGALANDGGITAGRNAVITAGSLASGNASALGAGVQDDGKLIGAGNLDVTVSGMLAANGTNLASGNATLQGSSVDLSGSQTSAANIAVTATSGNVNTGDKAKVVTPGSLSITANARAGQTLANDAGTLDAGLLKLQVLNITNTRGGEIVQTASDATTVAVSGVLNNDGGRIAGNSRDLTLRAARLGNARGTIQHAGSGTLNIAGGDYDGAGGRIATNGALVAGMSRAFNHDGGTTNARRITIEAGALSNRKGQIVQGGTDATRITVTGALDNTAGTIASNGDTVVRAVSLANQGGTVRSTGAAQLSITTTADLDNSSKGTISAGERVVVQAGRLDNSGGSITATQDLSVDAPDVKNTGGLIRAGGTARLNAKKIVNTETRGNELGIEGKNLAMKVETLDNSTGAIRAGQNATLVSGGTVDNTEGLMSAAGLLTIQDPNAGNPAGRTLVITNTRGSLQGGTAAVRNPNGTVKTPGVGGIRLHAKQLVNDGPLASANDLDIALSADAVNNAVISASGNLSYTTLGTLTNKGKLLAGGTANVGGTVVDNTVTGEISGGQGALVNASNTLNNRGLIDSQGLTAANKRHTQINAGTLNNIGTGRIYGDRISIAVGTLNNTTETVEGARSNASIASRGDLDIGASTLGNREGSYIFSLQQMAIGETLDADRRATGKGGTLDNLSASIESVGDMKIGMAQVNNLNKHLVVAQRQTVGELQLSITPPGGVEAPLNTIVKDPNDRHVWRINADGTRTYLGKGWTENYYRETTTTDYLASSDPARIVSGGNMAVDGLLRNHDSQVLAGGTITTTQPADNYETPGRQVTQATGYKIVIGVRTDGKDDHNEPYIRAPKVEVVKVSPWRYQERVNEANGTEPKRGQPMATGQGPGGTGAVNPGRPGGITEVPSAKGDTLTNEAGATRTVPVVVRTSIPDAAVPAASLFGVRRDPGSNYLVETDPRFTSYRKWLGSDYLLNNLGQDPHSTLKRLGDGFYEQKLIREQVAQLTGYRYLDGFGNDEEQYTALMNGGATFAKQFNIRPGIGLSAAQMAQLTSDIVWLVEQAVTLPDGTTQQVLVPQVYVRVRPGDIEGSGALISGNAVVMKERGDLRNTGTIAGREVVSITADNVNNLGGRITGDAVGIKAHNDVNNIGGTIDAASEMVIEAKRDINVQSTRSTQSVGGASRTNISQVAGLYVSNPDGKLTASAGRDLNLSGAVVANTGTDSTTLLKAKRNINVSTVKEEEHQERGRNTRNFHSQTVSREVGSQIAGGGDVTLDAGSDIRIRGSAINAQGDLALKAREGNVSVEAARATVAVDSASEGSTKGFLSSKTTTQRDSLREDTAVGSTLGGRNVIVSGRDVTVSGSEIIADENMAIVARRDLTIEAARNTRSESSYRGSGKSGLMGSGGFGFTIGSRSQSTDTQSDSTSAVRSTVGSIGGNTTLLAGNRYTQIGSDVVAPEGDVTIAAKSIAIREARETSRTESEQKQKSGGLTIALTAPVISAVQSIGNTAKAVQQTGSGRMQALGAASMAAEAKGVADALANASVTNPAQSMGVNLSISLGGSQNRSNRTETSDTAAGSRIEGKNVSLLALGGGKDSNILVQGSDIVARDTATLVADNRIDVLAAQNTSERRGTNQGSGGSVGVSFGTSGLLFNIGANGSKGKSDGTDSTYTNSHVSAGNKVSLASGGDMTIKGGVIEADRVAAKVGGDLKIESLQDTGTSASKQQSLGGSLSVGVGVWSVGVSASSAKASGNYASVKEQSGIKTGDGGFDVDVKGRTDLKGAVIESTQAAVDNAKNTFKSASLTTSDIQNFDSYKASGASLGLSVSGQQPKGEDKKPIPGSDFKVGSGGSAGVGSASGTQSSVTKAGISGIAGDQSVRTGVDSTNALTKKWDTEKLVGDVQAQTQITQTFGPAASKAVGDYASKQTGAYELAQLKASLAQKVLNDPNASDDQKAQASTDLANANGTLAAEKQNYENWKEGGTSRTWAHALMGGLAGNLQGAAGAALASTAAPVIDDLTRNLPDAVKGAVGAGLAAGFGAAGGGAAGAVAGFNEDFNNRQLHPLESAAIYDYARKLAARGAKDDSGKSLSANEWEQRLGRQALSETDSGFREYGTDQVAQRHLEELRGGLGTTFVDAQGRTQRFFQAQNEAEYNNHAINAGLLNESKWLYDKVGAPGVRPGTTAYLYALQAAAASDIGNLKKEPNGVKQGLFTALKDEYLASGKAMTPELMRSDPTKAARLESQQQALGNTLLRMVVDQGVDFLGVEDKKWYDVNIRTPALASIGGVGWGLGKIRAAGINGKKSPERAADGGKVGISATDGTATSPYGSSATNYGTATYADTKGQPLPSNIKNGLNYEVTTKSPFNTPSETIISPEMEVKILYGERVVNSSGAMTNRLIGAHGGDIGNGSKNYAVEIISTNPDGTRNAKLLMQFDDGALSKIKSSTLFRKGGILREPWKPFLKQQIPSQLPLVLMEERFISRSWAA